MNIQWKDKNSSDQRIFTLTDSHIERYPTFVLNLKHQLENMLPDDKISHAKNPAAFSQGSELKKLVEKLILEIKSGKQSFNDFTLLQKKNFNPKKHCGLIVLKFKNHPFVVKLFMETPETFANPRSKGIEPIFFFFMGGGASRHTSGLTRIANAHITQKKIQSLPLWANKVHIPRKWFLLPKNQNFLHFTGYNIGNETNPIQNDIPATYAIIADAIPTQKKLNIKHRDLVKISTQLCNDLDLLIDAHEDNFIFLRDPKTKKIHVTIIDTEHFPTMVGIKKKKNLKSIAHYYAFLSFKCVKDIYFRSKSARKAAQIEPRQLDII